MGLPGHVLGQCWPLSLKLTLGFFFQTWILRCALWLYAVSVNHPLAPSLAPALKFPCWREEVLLPGNSFQQAA